jgi:hypothetical protein
MALPVTVDANMAFPNRNYFLGPFKSSAGAIYVFGIDTADTNAQKAWKATDPTDSFTIQDEVGSPTDSDDTLWCDQEGDLIHTVRFNDSGASSLSYARFNMATDNWDEANTSIDSITNQPAVADQSCSIAIRSDGDRIVLYNGSTEKVHGTNYDRVVYAWWNGSSWSSNNAVSPTGGADDWTGSVIVRGSADRMHFCFKDDTLNDVYIRTLSGAATPALETMPSAIDASSSTIEHVWTKGVSYYNGTNHRVHCFYKDSDTSLAEVVFTSADAPTYGTPSTSILDDNPLTQNAYTPNAVANDDDEVFIVYIINGAPGDGKLARSNAEAAWGTDTLLIDVSANSNYTTLLGMSGNIYDRDGVGTVMGVLLDDNGTIKYTEVSDASNTNAVDINKSYTTLADAALDFPDQTFRVGPFKIVRA